MFAYHFNLNGVSSVFFILVWARLRGEKDTVFAAELILLAIGEAPCEQDTPTCDHVIPASS